MYSRALIPNDYEVPPFELTGLKRKVFLFVYCTILITSIIGLAYVFYVNPLFAVTALAFGYVIDNFLFAGGHIEFHTSFIEIPEHKMNILCHHSLIHHYRNSHVYHERWLETRTGYFMDAKSMWTVDWWVKGFLSISIFLGLAYFVDPVLGVGWYAAQAGPMLLQSTIHEWYHNPPKNRRSFYSYPAYLFFTLLEKLGVASTKGHALHHQHGLKNLSHVDKWLDLYVPFGETISERLWRKALTLYEPGKSRMNDWARRGLLGKLMVGYRILESVTIIGAYFLVGSLHRKIQQTFN